MAGSNLSGDLSRACAGSLGRCEAVAFRVSKTALKLDPTVSLVGPTIQCRLRLQVYPH